MKKLLILVTLLMLLFSMGCESPTNLDKPIVVTKIVKEKQYYVYKIRGHSYSSIFYEYTEFYSKQKRFSVGDTLSLYELSK